MVFKDYRDYLFLMHCKLFPIVYFDQKAFGPPCSRMESSIMFIGRRRPPKSEPIEKTLLESGVIKFIQKE